MNQADKTILLVEDNPDDVNLTLEAFTRNNMPHTVEVACDGVEALDYLFARAGFSARAGMPPPALILLDVQLPKLDGMGVLREIRAHPRTRLIPVVILTSSPEEDDLVQGYTQGANSYVRKPVDFDAFSAAAKLLGIYWLSNTGPAPAPAVT